MAIPEEAIQEEQNQNYNENFSSSSDGEFDRANDGIIDVGDNVKNLAIRNSEIPKTQEELQFEKQTQEKKDLFKSKKMSQLADIQNSIKMV